MRFLNVQILILSRRSYVITMILYRDFQPLLFNYQTMQLQARESLLQDLVEIHCSGPRKLQSMLHSDIFYNTKLSVTGLLVSHAGG